MNVNLLLLGALENILGKGHKRARGNYAFHCPHCSHRKPKLEVNLDQDSAYYGHYECWVCGIKGRSIKSLLRHLQASPEEAREILYYAKQDSDSEKEVEAVNRLLSLPEEFQSLYTASADSYEANRYKQYLYSRGLVDDDFIKYGIGYCSSGKFADRVIIPSYDENNRLNYFIARSISPDPYLKYLNPEASRDIIYFENLINWTQPIILCEGVFDAIAIKRNCTCLLGKNISSALMKKIIENPVPEIYMVMDQDARKAAIKHCETFLDLGKKVYFVKPPKKDPSESGFELMTKTLQTAEELTFRKLMELKLEM